MSVGALAVEGLPKCDVLRTWPADWHTPSLLARPDATFPSPGRYLHADVAVEVRPERGRCAVARRHITKGTLVLTDCPMAVAPSREVLVGKLCSSTSQDLLLGMCGDREDEKARAIALRTGRTDRKLIERIVRHNHYEVEAAPRDGESSEEPPECGLWPLAAVVNHSLHPNVTRCFLGHQVFLRLLRDVDAGEELCDNYIDPRLPQEERVAFLASVHGIEDEGPDKFDAGEEQFGAVQHRLLVAKSSLEEEKFLEADKALVSAAELCRSYEILDPAFTDVFWALADLAAQSGDAAARQDWCCQAMRYATAREPHSTVSCQLAVCRAHALVAARSQKSTGFEELVMAESVARSHFRAVYGPEPEIFDLLNPELTAALRTLLPPAAEAHHFILDSMD